MILILLYVHITLYVRTSALGFYRRAKKVSSQKKTFNSGHIARETLILMRTPSKRRGSNIIVELVFWST